MAIGFLFLGGGRYTIDTSLSGIAGLLCAVFPRWPTTPDDNRYHLQALRHLWVTSCVPRYIQTKDVDTGRPCHVTINVTLRDRSVVSLSTPCLLPPVTHVSSLTIASTQYWSYTLDVATNASHGHVVWNNRVLYVKRTVDPHYKPPPHVHQRVGWMPTFADTRLVAFAK
jgi:anaphase-promoting complex subunit 1